MYLSDPDVAEVPPGVVTVTSTVPFAVPAGAVAVIVVELTTTTLVAFAVPNFTADAPVRLVPVMVTESPPPAAPEVGLTAVTVGAGVPADTTSVPLTVSLPRPEPPLQVELLLEPTADTVKLWLPTVVAFVVESVSVATLLCEPEPVIWMQVSLKEAVIPVPRLPEIESATPIVLDEKLFVAVRLIANVAELACGTGDGV